MFHINNQQSSGSKFKNTATLWRVRTVAIRVTLFIPLYKSLTLVYAEFSNNMPVKKMEKHTHINHRGTMDAHSAIGMGRIQ